MESTHWTRAESITYIVLLHIVYIHDVSALCMCTHVAVYLQYMSMCPCTMCTHYVPVSVIHISLHQYTVWTCLATPAVNPQCICYVSVYSCTHYLPVSAIHICMHQYMDIPCSSSCVSAMYRCTLCTYECLQYTSVCISYCMDVPCSSSCIPTTISNWN